MTATASYDVLADIERELQIPDDDGNALVRYENTVRDEINYCIIEAPVNLEGKRLTKNVRNLIGEQKQRLAIKWLTTLDKKLKEWNTKRFDQITEQSYETFLPEVEKQVKYPTLDKYQKEKSDHLLIEDELLNMETGDAATVIFVHKKGSHGVKDFESMVGKLLPEFPVGSFMVAVIMIKRVRKLRSNHLKIKPPSKKQLSIMVATKAFGMGLTKRMFVVRSEMHQNRLSHLSKKQGAQGDRKLSMILINKDKPEVK